MVEPVSERCANRHHLWTTRLPQTEIAAVRWADWKFGRTGANSPVFMPYAKMGSKLGP